MKQGSFFFFNSWCLVWEVLGTGSQEQTQEGRQAQLGQAVCKWEVRDLSSPGAPGGLPVLFWEVFLKKYFP